MFYLKKVLGFLILSQPLPLMVWAINDESYQPKGAVDVWFNKIHPYVAGLIIEAMAVVFVLVLVFGINLATAKK